jgi:restriction system protein
LLYRLFLADERLREAARMARRRKTSAFDDLIHIASRLPWWLSLLIALIAWFWLHSYAISPPPVATADPKQITQLMAGSAFRTIAMVLQFMVPAAFVLGVVGSVIARAKRRKLIVDVASATNPGKTIEGISWQQFEQLTGEAFRRQGFTVTETGGNGPDGGIDLILHKDREKYLVQCKQWRSLKVGVAVIREFFGVIAAEGAVGGFVVTSGAFTAEAKAFASGRNIRLVEGAELNRWITASRSTQSTPPVRAPTQINPAPQLPVPSCPVCRSAMQKRTAKRGVNIGNEFWGCSQYPKCRGVVQI